LLANNALRAALADEPEELGPEVAGIIFPLAFSRARERLARAASGPHWSVGWPSGKLEGEWPAADAGEKVGLGEPPHIVGLDFLDWSLIYGAFGDKAGSH
jgi:hypothetical protein